MKDQLVEIIVPQVPAELWHAIQADAQQQNLSRNEVAVAALAARYGVDREPSPIRFRNGEVNVARPLQLTVPARLRSKLRRAADTRNATISGLVREALAEHYGLPPQPVTRRPRTRA